MFNWFKDLVGVEHFDELTFDSYQNEANSTANEKLNEHDALMEASLGLAGEAGELVDLIKKQTFHGRELDVKAVEKELGDVMWYAARLARLYGLKLSDVVKQNITKLRARYPKGYSTSDSLVRRDV